MPESTIKPRRTEGITIRHSRDCGSSEVSICRCRPAFQAQVFSPRDRRTIRRSFRSLSEARAWRTDTQTALRRGTMRAPTRTTLAEAADDWLAAAKAGIARARSGDPYKPSALRSYEEALRTKALPELGNLRLSAVDRVAVQDFVDRLVARGLAPSTVRNSVLPLRAIFRRAVSRSEVIQNPTLGLSLPAVRGSRDRVARPEEARVLIVAVPDGDRALWATALYAGLRRGELQALRWADVDLDAGLIRVERSWDPKAGPIEPKSRAGTRRVPLVKPLRIELAAHRLRQGGGGEEGLVLGRGERPFAPGAATRRAREAWSKEGLEAIGLHECRHTYASFMIAAGVNAKALSTYMGHSSITITLDRYGHLMPGLRQRRRGCSRTISSGMRSNEPVLPLGPGCALLDAMKETPSHQLTAADIPDPEDRSALAEFAHTFDGYRHFSERYEERMNAVRERWEADGTLPDDLDDLRACLFLEHRRERFVELDDVISIWDPDGTLVHEADPERVTPERAAQDRYRSAVVARIAELLDERR